MHCADAIAFDEETAAPSLAGLKPLGQVRNSFILAVDASGLWIIDQHVAHERVLFERLLQQANSKDGSVQGQRLLLPLIIELRPEQQVVFAEIGDELARNGFEMEPFGARTVAIKTAPAGVEATSVEHLLHELLENCARESQATNLDALRTAIAASIACHAAIKVNMPLDQKKMEWLLAELAKTECPMSCPHGRPVVLRYSLRDIQRAFKRI
jgi:DNA mismatch repair protein MutL